jgi:hypothetical protein
MTFRDSLGQFFFGSYFEQQREALAQARLQLAEDSFAIADAAAGRSDRNDKAWGDRIQDLDDALDAWAINPYARRIVNLYTAHVIGRSLTLTTPYDDINAWISAWWNH